jgi:hypothetical protein
MRQCDISMPLLEWVIKCLHYCVCRMSSSAVVSFVKSKPSHQQVSVTLNTDYLRVLIMAYLHRISKVITPTYSQIHVLVHRKVPYVLKLRSGYRAIHHPRFAARSIDLHHLIQPVTLFQRLVNMSGWSRVVVCKGLQLVQETRYAGIRLANSVH